MSNFFTGLSAGGYDITVTDNNACTEFQSNTLAEPTQLIAIIATTDASCFGDDGTATVTVTDYSNIATGATLTFNKSDGTTVTFTCQGPGSSPTPETNKFFHNINLLFGYYYQVNNLVLKFLCLYIKLIFCMCIMQNKNFIFISYKNRSRNLNIFIKVLLRLFIRNRKLDRCVSSPI